MAKVWKARRPATSGAGHLNAIVTGILGTAFRIWGRAPKTARPYFVLYRVGYAVRDTVFCYTSKCVSYLAGVQGRVFYLKLRAI